MASPRCAGGFTLEPLHPLGEFLPLPHSQTLGSVIVSDDPVDRVTTCNACNASASVEVRAARSTDERRSAEGELRSWTADEVLCDVHWTERTCVCPCPKGPGPGVDDVCHSRSVPHLCELRKLTCASWHLDRLVWRAAFWIGPCVWFVCSWASRRGEVSHLHTDPYDGVPLKEGVP